MQGKIKDVARIITGDRSGNQLPVASDLSQCAVDIAAIAFTCLSGALREKALNVAKAIVAYEDEIIKQ
ncbi:MAG: hypothetical protein PHU23_15805 [Dehalococcoidales bacterium]|nr:hypothetical protein [Dehalococcoidales bacterium]